MKKIFLSVILLITFILICSCNPSNINSSKTKYDVITTKRTEIKQIVSSEVDDTFYVYIRLPKNYNPNSNKRYPVLYLLDGDISFNLATSAVRYLQFGKTIPEMFIVAPAYGTMMSDEEVNFRERDYTITKTPRFKNSGGADKYLNFLTKELIPLIDSIYRTNDNRILNGYSLGGLFTVNTLLKKPDVFNSFIAGSPYLINDLKKFLDRINELKNHSFNNKIFISVGELENKNFYQMPTKLLVDNLNNLNGLDVKFVKFKDGTHFTCPSEALVYGLKFVFGN